MVVKKTKRKSKKLKTIKNKKYSNNVKYVGGMRYKPTEQSLQKGLSPNPLSYKYGSPPNSLRRKSFKIEKPLFEPNPKFALPDTPSVKNNLGHTVRMGINAIKNTNSGRENTIRKEMETLKKSINLLQQQPATKLAPVPLKKRPIKRGDISVLLSTGMTPDQGQKQVANPLNESKQKLESLQQELQKLAHLSNQQSQLFTDPYIGIKHVPKRYKSVNTKPTIKNIQSIVSEGVSKNQNTRFGPYMNSNIISVPNRPIRVSNAYIKIGENTNESMKTKTGSLYEKSYPNTKNQSPYYTNLDKNLDAAQYETLKQRNPEELTKPELKTIINHLDRIKDDPQSESEYETVMEKFYPAYRLQQTSPDNKPIYSNITIKEGKKLNQLLSTNNGMAVAASSRREEAQREEFSRLSNKKRKKS